jgi:cob(I)alamin adenosyltransferase
MSSFYTRTGDDGYTGLLGAGRVPKYDLRPEVLGTLDEAAAALGVARNFCQAEGARELIVRIQRDLYALMAEAAATPETSARFHVIDEKFVAWLEKQIDSISAKIEIPREFIVPGDSDAGGFLDVARTVVRRAERRVAELLLRGDISNAELLRYLNRLSSLCFVLELQELHPLGKASPTLAKTTIDDRNLD